MQTLLNPHPLLPIFLHPKPLLKPCKSQTNLHLNPTIHIPSRTAKFIANSFSSDEFPVDDDFLQQFAPKDRESVEETRRRNWIERGWAPWEEILSFEGDFAKTSLNEGEEVPLQNPDSIEAFKMLQASYRKQKWEELGMTEDEFYASRFAIRGEIPEPLKTNWTGPLVLMMMPPRDWPPRGWEVDKKELEYIREAHKLTFRVDTTQVHKEARSNTDDMCLDRYKVFLKQYKEWVAANKDRLEEESYKYDQDYYPGRRKRGKDYKEGMYELPFYYPGQICLGKVTTLHLYQGAFVDIGGVHDGWVPIRRNDWYWIRHHIKVGMEVFVEILAKRDPFRFRFPIEMRFVDPNIDHLVFNRFEYPPIFHREEDTNPDELRRDCGRPPVPRKDPFIKVEEEPLISNHPYVDTLWEIHNAEQMILDDMECNPEKYKDKKLSELGADEVFDEENRVEYGEGYFKKTLLPKTIINVSMKDLDLEAAFAERQYHNELRRQVDEMGKKYKIDGLSRNYEMDDYDFLHWRRSVEEREALLRDISSRKAVGLPLEEPGRFVHPSLVDKGKYDPENPLYRYDYWGEPRNTEKKRQMEIMEEHNKSIIDDDNTVVWNQMSYEKALRLQERNRKTLQSLKMPREESTNEPAVSGANSSKTVDV